MSTRILAGVIAMIPLFYSVLEADEYEIGGPLAGPKLPLFKTQHGEKPGYPGNLPGQYDHDPLAPELQLYPGSVEHYRAYMFKYMPIRSFFDRQSMLQNWVAPDIPGVDSSQVEEYASPVYHVPRHAPCIDTGFKLKPVPVVRCRVGSPVIELELGELDTGLYAVRVIGAVETKKLRSFREPLYLRAEVNDGISGEKSIHRLRLGYCDEFYSVAEIYFHAHGKRAYTMKLMVDQGSKVDLLVHNVTLDDALAGTDRRIIKTHKAFSDKGAEQGIPSSKEERSLRDDTIWKAFPPINRQGSHLGQWSGDEHVLSENVFLGVSDKSREQIEAEFGIWERPGELDDTANRGVFLVNRKLGLRYTVEDLANHKPLPEPYPYKDDGSGLYYPDPENPGQGKVWAPVAAEVSNRIRDYYRYISERTGQWQRTGEPDRAHDAAIALARWAYSFPTIDFANYLSSLVRDKGPYGRDYRCRRRETVALFLPHYAGYVETLYNYDSLYNFIKDNQDLAESIGRYVPWVRTPQDVIKLIDVYLLQTTAKRIMRYHYHTDPMEIANLASIVGDNTVTDPWMEWLFSRTFIYPLPPVGIQDAMVTGCERDGCEYIGSSYYAQGEGASRVALALERYVDAGGNAEYNLSDQERYPKPAAHVYWRLKNVVAGWDFLRIGDVAGPDKAPGHTLRELGFARAGWKWMQDPGFAFIIRNYLERSNETDPEWERISEAAAEVKRAPWLDNRSRMMPMWASILESGLEHDDPRFRRAAYVRIGFGVGHQHNDTMDLQVVAHGQPATIDAGQRGGYSTPSDRNTRVHNVVEVDGEQIVAYSWASTLADATGAQYTQVEAEPPGNTTLFRRQVALIDVDEGEDSRPLAIPQQRPGAELPDGITPANSYVFDVFRVAGGVVHTYCFHGTVNDAFQWNVPDAEPVEPGDESDTGRYLGKFGNLPEMKFAGTAPATLEAVWRQKRMEHQRDQAGSEELMLGENFHPDLPRRFTKLHLFDVEGAHAMRANLDCFQWKYDFTCLMVQKVAEAETQDSAYAAIVEPYIGEPFITENRLLPIVNNEADARRAVAVEVKTANGHTDLCFADGRPQKAREIANMDLTVSGEFAYYSTDDQGFRQATLVGGTILDAPGIKLKTARRERIGTVSKVDYSIRTVWLDQQWPARDVPGVFEIGLPGHKTSYTALNVAPDNDGTRITVENGADYFRAPIVDINPQDSTVKCALGLTMNPRPGTDKNWVASDDDMTTFWRADVVGDKTFRLQPGPINQEMFGKAGVLRLWEYGVGDMVRQSTFVSIRRLDGDIYELSADVDVEVSLPGKEIETSKDKASWESISTQKADGLVGIAIPVEDLSSDGRIYLRVSH
jgi:hypothetical protein